MSILDCELFLVAVQFDRKLLCFVSCSFALIVLFLFHHLLHSSFLGILSFRSEVLLIGVRHVGVWMCRLLQWGVLIFIASGTVGGRTSRIHGGKWCCGDYLENFNQRRLRRHSMLSLAKKETGDEVFWPVAHQRFLSSRLMLERERESDGGE
jgi:hypothetical protein